VLDDAVGVVAVRVASGQSQRGRVADRAADEVDQRRRRADRLI
jgi:hypothetical protein